MLSKWLTEILVLLAVGLGVACVCLWLHEHDIYLFRSFWKRVRKMSIIGLCAAVLWAVPFVQLGGTKGGGDGGGTNNVQNVANVEMLPMANFNTQLGTGNIGTGNISTMATLITSTNTTRTITGDDFRRGFVMTRIGTDEAFDFAAPSNAVVCADWRAFGAATDWIYVALTNWAFQVATNDVDRMRIYAFGKIEPQIMEAGGQIATNYWFAPLMASLGIAPEANWDWLAESDSPSQLWHYVTPSNTLQITWQNALLDRDTDTPLSFQIEFRADGQFTYRYDLSRSAHRE